MKYALYARKSSEDKKRQVQSVPDQIRILTQIAKSRGLDVTETIADEKSAKAPGRPGFGKLMKLVAAKEVQGILCWRADRLARNPIDGASIMWQLQQGVIEEIVTPERIYRPEDNSLILNVEFGMATQYSRDLRRNVVRGMESKVEKGWMPTKAPIGYRNETMGIKGEKRILPDKRYFPVLQSLWQKLLRDQCSLMQLYAYMGEKCPIFVRHSRHGIISFSSFHRIFHNPFYSGLFRWDGQWRIGKHKRMVTQREFEEAQQILAGKTKLRNRGLHFDLKGLFHCGECGALITAEQHQKIIKTTNEQKSFRYYRCGHRKKATTCREKPMAEAKIDQYILQQIEEFSVPSEILEFGIGKLKTELENPFGESGKEQQLSEQIQALKTKIKMMKVSIAEESDSETRAFIKERINELQVQQRGLEQDIRKERSAWFEPYTEVSNRLELIINAKERFTNGTPEERQNIVRGLGSNWRIQSQTLHYEPHFVSLALQKTKKRHKADLARFEPLESRLDTSKSLTCELVSSIWSSLWELIRN